MYRKLHQISLDWINDHSLKLKEFSNLTEETIKRIFYEYGDEDVEDLSTIIYDWDIPLYQKMIFRFRNTNYRPEQFYKELDPTNRKALLNNFSFNFNFDRTDNYFEFFAYIKNWLNVIYIKELGDNLVQKWKENNGITFFLSLDDEQKTKIIDKYNKEVVEFHNNRQKIDIKSVW